MPEIVSEPNGGVGLEWYRTKHMLVVLSVNGTGVITFAGMEGRGETFGGTRTLHESNLSAVLEYVERILA